MEIEKRVDLTERDQNTLSFLRYRRSTYMLIAAIGSCMETILGRPITNKFSLRFIEEKALDAYIDDWTPLPPLEKGLKSQSEVISSLTSFKR